MPSPFPGMNSYLEQEDVWRDFHKRFIACMATLLDAQASVCLRVALAKGLERWLGSDSLR